MADCLFCRIIAGEIPGSIVYSDERPLRWAFISGRRYVEGDAIGDGARVEEIQSNGVVIVEDGRRITLRP